MPLLSSHPISTTATPTTISTTPVTVGVRAIASNISLALSLHPFTSLSLDYDDLSDETVSMVAERSSTHLQSIALSHGDEMCFGDAGLLALVMSSKMTHVL